MLLSQPGANLERHRGGALNLPGFPRRTGLPKLVVHRQQTVIGGLLAVLNGNQAIAGKVLRDQYDQVRGDALLAAQSDHGVGQLGHRRRIVGRDVQVSTVGKDDTHKIALRPVVVNGADDFAISNLKRGGNDNFHRILLCLVAELVYELSGCLAWLSPGLV